MKKAILVMDMPKSCDGCLLHGTMIGKQICNAEIKRVKDESIKPDWCPLKEMPEPIDVSGCKTEITKARAQEYNALLARLSN